MFELWIATWMAFSYADSPSFKVFKSSQDAIDYVESIFKKNAPNLQEGKVTLHRIHIKKLGKTDGVETINLQLERETQVKTRRVLK